MRVMTSFLQIPAKNRCRKSSVQDLQRRQTCQRQAPDISEGFLLLHHGHLKNKELGFYSSISRTEKNMEERASILVQWHGWSIRHPVRFSSQRCTIHEFAPHSKSLPWGSMEGYRYQLMSSVLKEEEELEKVAVALEQGSALWQGCSVEWRHCAASVQALYFGELASHTTVFKGDSNCHGMIQLGHSSRRQSFPCVDAWQPHSLLRVAASYETMRVVILNCSRKTTPCWLSTALSHHRK